MEVVHDEGVKDIIREELSKLGINGSPVVDCKKRQPSKFLNKPMQAGIGKNFKYKKHLPSDLFASSPHKLSKEIKKNGPKSPFGGTKQRSSSKKKKTNLVPQNKMFGRILAEICRTKVTLSDGNTVLVPSFLVDACNLLRKHITLEGLFRKAGSSSRQNEIKRIIDTGENLPCSAHPIDIACLIKQFFRCLPEPLLESTVHTRMLRCQLGLADNDARVSGLLLSSMLLSEPNQHTFVYFLNFLSEVVLHSSANRMDAYNLAVVLSPNLLPMSLPGLTVIQQQGIAVSANRKPTNKVDGFSLSEDYVLAANIDIMQELITHQDRVCRLPRDILTGLLSDRALKQQQQLLSDVDGGSGASQALRHPPPVSKTKKRRSASIHRLMAGLRRVVGAPPQQQSSSVFHAANSPHPLAQHRIVTNTGHLATFACSPTLAQVRVSPSPLLLSSPGHKSPAHGYHTPLMLSLNPMPQSAADEAKSLTMTSPFKRKSDSMLEDVEGNVPNKKARVSPVELTSSSSDGGRGRPSGTVPLSYAAAARALHQGPTAVTKNIKVRRSHTAREFSSRKKLKVVGDDDGEKTSSLHFSSHTSLSAFLDQHSGRTKQRVDKGKQPTLNSCLRSIGTGGLSHSKLNEEVIGRNLRRISNVSTSFKMEKSANEGNRDLSKPNVSSDLTVEKSDDFSIRTGDVHRMMIKSYSEVANSPAKLTLLKPCNTDSNLKTQNMLSDTISLSTTVTTETPRTNPVPKWNPTKTVDDKVLTPVNSASAETICADNDACLISHQCFARSSGRRSRRRARNARLKSLVGQDTDGKVVELLSREEINSSKSLLRDISPAKRCLDENEKQLHILEEQYDSIKSAVVSMEQKIDCESLNAMKESTLFGNEVTSIVALNHSKIIQSAYNKIEKESRVLGVSPSETLSRRLDRELKIRRRRSGEDCVVRSPSERKIGIIRRRSKELELKINHANAVPTNNALRTPKLKDNLVKSPLSQSLRRGRPNAIRSGLPVIIRREPLTPTQCDLKVELNTSSLDISCSLMADSADLMNASSQYLSEITAVDKRDEARNEIFSPTFCMTSENSTIIRNFSGVRDTSNSLNSLSSDSSSVGRGALPEIEQNIDECCEEMVPSANFENENWLSASDFLAQVHEESDSATDSGGEKRRDKRDGNRPSIAALKKQKKVTANVQLFNQLGNVGSLPTPGQQRRQSRRLQQQQLFATPLNAASMHARSAMSERRNQMQQRARTANLRASLTPRHFANALRPQKTAVKIAVVSPLRENIVNMTKPAIIETPVRMKRVLESNDVFKTPVIPPRHTPQRKKHSCDK